MLNFLWSGMIVFSIIISVFTGTLNETVNAGLNGGGEAVKMCIELLGIMCLWNGIMKIAEQSGVIEKITVVIKPLFRALFKGVDEKSKAGEYIIMNLTANLLGMGNAATPAGINAMQELDKTEKGKDNMLLFTVLNTTSFQLIPSTLIAMRASFGSANPGEIIVPVWCVSAISVLVVVLCSKCIKKKI